MSRISSSLPERSLTALTPGTPPQVVLDSSSGSSCPIAADLQCTGDPPTDDSLLAHEPEQSHRQSRRFAHLLDGLPWQDAP